MTVMVTPLLKVAWAADVQVAAWAVRAILALLFRIFLTICSATWVANVVLAAGATVPSVATICVTIFV